MKVFAEYFLQRLRHIMYKSGTCCRRSNAEELWLSETSAPFKEECTRVFEREGIGDRESGLRGYSGLKKKPSKESSRRPLSGALLNGYGTGSLKRPVQ